jgi:hypothetical protein
MKNFSLLIGLLASSLTFAQENADIKIDTFISDYDHHAIHKVNPVEVISKVEGNRTCLNEENGQCEYWAVQDKIILKISGMAEANFGGFNKIIAREESLMDDYSSGKSITRLELKGVRTSESGTLVYDDLPWAQWGGSIPFEFKVEINNNINKDSEEKEFRIPVGSDIFRFKVSYVDAKWTVETLSTLSESFKFGGTLAQEMFELGTDGPQDTYAQYSIACLKADGLSPECLVQNFDVAKKMSSELSTQMFEAAKSNLQFFKMYVNISVKCQAPSKWDNLKETTCTLALK